MASNHTEFTMPVLFKELDHIQAILGRFDTFFFLMKQLCLVYVSAVLGLYFDNEKVGHPAIALVVPVTFMVFDTSFRYCFWTSYIHRVTTIEAYLNGEIDRTRLYVLNEKAPRKYRIRHAFKKFDVVFYFMTIIVTLAFSGPDVNTFRKFVSRAANGCHDVQTLAPAAPNTKPSKS